MALADGMLCLCPCQDANVVERARGGWSFFFLDSLFVAQLGLDVGKVSMALGKIITRLGIRQQSFKVVTVPACCAPSSLSSI